MKFYGEVGFGESVVDPEDSGQWNDTIVEKSYSGDVVRATARSSEGEKVINDLSVTNSIAIMADAYLLANFMNIRYVKWNGVRWTVPSTEPRPPRFILNPGEVYSGPLPSEPEGDPE